MGKDIWVPASGEGIGLVGKPSTKCLAVRHPHTTTESTQRPAGTQQKFVHAKRKRDKSQDKEAFI